MHEHKRNLPIFGQKAGSFRTILRESHKLNGNYQLPNNQRKNSLEESQVNSYYYINMEIQTPSETDTVSTSEKTDDAFDAESSETLDPRRNQPNKPIFLILLFILAFGGMGILALSSCGGSISVKLFTGELEFNNSCHVEKMPSEIPSNK